MSFRMCVRAVRTCVLGWYETFPCLFLMVYFEVVGIFLFTLHTTDSSDAAHYFLDLYCHVPGMTLFLPFVLGCCVPQTRIVLCFSSVPELVVWVST